MAVPVSDALVFFGATGDLAGKQIYPALQGLVRHKHLDLPIIGVARRDLPIWAAAVDLVVPDEVDVILIVEVVIDTRGLELAVVYRLRIPGKVVAVVIAVGQDAADQRAAGTGGEGVDGRIARRQSQRVIGKA